ncbi:MAG: hypothetical protein LH610_08145 [Sphingomonas bacterium]|nr:hypothetical protein [Sphingomonas bacterium]
MKKLWRDYALIDFILPALFALALAVGLGIARPSDFREYAGLFSLLLFCVGVRDLRHWLIRRQIDWQEKRSFSLLRLVRRKFSRSKAGDECGLPKSEVTPDS